MVAVLPANRAGYGDVSDEYPELSISVFAPYRGSGLGTQLISRVLESARRQKIPGISLSVDAGNRAHNLYERMGFVWAGPGYDEGTLLYRFEYKQREASEL